MIPVVLNPGGKRRRSFRKALSRRRRRGVSKRSRSARRAYLRRLLCGGKGSRGRMRKARAHYCRVPKASSPSTLGWLLPSEKSVRPYGWSGNPRHRRRHARWNYRRGHNNPAVTGRMMGGIKSAFSPSKLVGALPMIGGIFANNYARNFLGGMLPAAVGPGTYGNLGIGVATSGLLAYVTNMVMPRYAPAVLMGGLVEVAMALANQALGLSMKGCAGCRGLGCAGCGGLFDYYTANKPIMSMLTGLRGGSADGGVYMAPEHSYAAPPSAEELAPDQGGDEDMF